MKRFRNTLLALGGVVVLALTLLSSATGRAIAASAAAQIQKVVFTDTGGNPVGNNVNSAARAEGLTHLRTFASDHVTLATVPLGGQPSCFAATDVCVFQRILPSGGTAAGTPVPNSGGLYEYTPPDGKVLVVTDFSWRVSGAHASQYTDVRVLVMAPLGSQLDHLSTSALADASGHAASTVALQSGFVVPHNGFLFVYPEPDNSGTIEFATLHGYLADDK